MNINWYPGHMKKTADMIRSDLNQVDIVYEILDARIPRSSRNPDIDNIVGDKKRILLLNKADLAEAKENKKWIEYFAKKNLIAVETNVLTGKGFKMLFKKTDELMENQREKDKERGLIYTPTRIMVIGIPNVGKSSLINRLVGRRSTKTGNLAGVTKAKQWVKAENGMELMDTPGVLWPRFDDKETALYLAFTGAITDRVIDEENLAFELLKLGIKEEYSGMIKRYGEIKSEETIEYMDMIGKKRGFLIRNGEIDYERIAKTILDEYRQGLWGPITLERA